MTRCEAHGLAYDASLRTGCVLCRRSGAPAAATDEGWLGLAMGLLLALAAGAAATWWAMAGEKPRSPEPQLSGGPTVGGEPARNDPALLPEAEGALRTINPDGRSGAFLVPAQSVSTRVPVLVMLHGTGGSGRAMTRAYGALAREHGFAVVAPDSRRTPGGVWSWEVGTEPNEVTPDLEHVMACLDELVARFPERVDAHDALIAGHSGGASSAPYAATNRRPFGAFAVLHGGVFPGGLGPRQVRGWFSTGSADPIRTPSMVKQALALAREQGLRAEYHEFPGGHGMSQAEMRALIEWWLAGR